jgi:Protein of unknown function (DUF1570)
MQLPTRLSILINGLFFAVLLFSLAPTAGAKDVWVEVRSSNFTVISNAGEKEARKVADQFEQFREMFHSVFPKLRVDLGKPLIIFAAKNEDSLRGLIPVYWEQKGRAHPSGLYVAGEDRHYVVLQTDVQTENPYQVVYHEYTHAIINLNFRGLPVWLNEGLAEYFGNSTIHDKYVEIGKVPAVHLRTLQEGRLIPIETLFEADEHSPLYNEQNHASMFYAESWVIVHYLMLDPEAHKRQLLNTFMADWDASGDQLQAAEKAFGDLRKFASTIELYAHQPTFYWGKANTEIHSDPKSYPSRVLPEAELDAQRALFYAHTQRPKEATAAAEEATKADPKFALGYEAQGFLMYSQQQFPEAAEAFARAIELQSSDYFTYYFAAEAHLRSNPRSTEDAKQVIDYLETALRMNPQFAPAYAALASTYSMDPGTRDKALALGAKAALLEPGNLFYATNYAYVLANAGKTADAKKLVISIQKAAKTPVEQANTEQLLRLIASREEYDRQVAAMKQQAEEEGAAITVNSPKAAVVSDGGNNAGAPVGSIESARTRSVSDAHQGENEWVVEGNVLSASCGGGPGKVTIGVGRATMNFRFPSFAEIDVVSTAKQDAGGAPACTNWKGRHVRLYFFKVKEKEFAGELSTLQFL